jgi:hypothetical protein
MESTTSLRKTSVLFGLYFAGTFLFSIPALVFYAPLLGKPEYVLGAGSDARIAMGALFEVLLAICNVGTAIVLYPVARRVSEAMALGYVAVRIVESLLILAGVIALMSIVSLRAAPAPTADSEAVRAVSQGLLAFHDWTFLLGPQFCAGLGNGLILGSLMYRSRRVPPRMAMVGIIGGPLAFVGGVLVLFGALRPMSGGLFALTALEIVWEVWITYYALRIGFRGDSTT